MQRVKKMARNILAAAQSPDGERLEITLVFLLIMIVSSLLYILHCHLSCAVHIPVQSVNNLSNLNPSFSSPTSSKSHTKQQSQPCLTKTLECSSSYNARASGQSEVSTKLCMTWVWQKKHKERLPICSGPTPLHINFKFKLYTGVPPKKQHASAT